MPDPREGRVTDTGAYFAALSQDLMSDRDVQVTLDKIGARALDVIPSGDFAGITVRQRRGRLATLSRTDEQAFECDELQYELNEGPCIAAAVEDEPFLVASAGDDPRWPRWGPRVAELGVHSLISVQLPVTVIDPDRDPLGAINIYSRVRNAFTEADLERALVYAVHAANALTAAHLAATLGEAVESRHHIGVAQGVLMQRYGITLQQAFDGLLRYSSHANVKVHEVATAVIADGGFPENYEDLAPTGEDQGIPSS